MWRSLKPKSVMGSETNYPTASNATTTVASTAKHWNVRNNHIGCESLNTRKAIATAANTTDKATHVVISSRIHLSPPGPTVIADDRTSAMANKTQRYQDTVVTVMASSL